MTIEINGKKVGRKSKIEKKREEASRIKRVAMKKVGDGSAIQPCITEYEAGKVLRIIPNDVLIENIDVIWGQRKKSIKLEKDKALLKESGASRIYCRTRPSQLQVEVGIRNKYPRQAYKALLPICREFSLEPNSFTVKALDLTKDGAILRFRGMLKSLPEGGDKRKKTPVLAWEETNRDPELEKKAKDIAARFHMENFRCEIVTVEKKISICTKV